MSDKSRLAYNARQKRQRRLRQGLNYDLMLAQQRGVCAACGLPPKKHQLCRDHNHSTGAVRGLLCHSCNMALGLLKDDPSRILGLLNYLESVGEYDPDDFEDDDE